MNDYTHLHLADTAGAVQALPSMGPVGGEGVASVRQLPEDVPGKMLVDLTVARHWLTAASPGVLVPIVTGPVPDENASALLNLADKVHPLHAIRISPTFRTPGMCPPVRSS